MPPSPPPSYPELFGHATANVALFASGIALLFTGLSLIYVWRTFRRAGALVKVTFDPDKTVIWSGVPEEHCPMVTATNSGLAAVQARNLYFEVKGEKDGTVPRGFVHGTLPTSIDGLSQTEWVLSRTGLPPTKARTRAVVQLAGMRNRKSKWVVIPEYPDH